MQKAEEIRKAHVVPLVGTWIETVLEEIRGQEKMSFPSWERGLKPGVDVFRHADPGWSFPSWERGLKQEINEKLDALLASFPSWERGLKHQAV